MEDNTDHPLSEFDDSDQDNTYAPPPEESNNLGTPQQPQINTGTKQYDQQSSETQPENETHAQKGTQVGTPESDQSTSSSSSSV